MLGRLANCLLPHILRGRSVYQLRMIRYHYGHNVIMLYIGRPFDKWESKAGVSR
uniref:Uncharacterized protein n=1 Tax=Picea glauca TaxID=3330 RepID=A0A101M4G5_PICGL|nr:hypothetical protein ABT39_MTgene583 [Picea glauca]QHR87550.1 hypothetical protein Q903MT_gene1561 [Picea sitchensis]